MAAQTPFPINADYTAIAINYRNRALIADAVLPRVPVGRSEFKYMKYNKDEAFTIPDTKIGRKSVANVVEAGGTEVTDSTVDYALKDVVPLTDIQNAPDGYDPIARATEFTTNLLDLDRETRVAGSVFNASNYGTANKATLGAGTQWNDSAADPIKAMLDAMDGMIMRPNVLIVGASVWTALRVHPKVVAAAYGARGVGAASSAAGVVARQVLADLLELEDVVVGQSFVNTAKKGQTASYAAAWGKFAALIYRDTLAGTEGTSFGFTASFMGRETRDWFDPEIGRSGAQVVQVSDSVKEVITAPDLGYLFSAAVA